MKFFKRYFREKNMKLISTWVKINFLLINLQISSQLIVKLHDNFSTNELIESSFYMKKFISFFSSYVFFLLKKVSSKNHPNQPIDNWSSIRFAALAGVKVVKRAGWENGERKQENQT